MKKAKTILSIALALAMVLCLASCKATDKKAAAKVAELIDAIYVQEWNEKTDEQCAAAKAAWDKLTDE